MNPRDTRPDRVRGGGRSAALALLVLGRIFHPCFCLAFVTLVAAFLPAIARGEAFTLYYGGCNNSKDEGAGGGSATLYLDEGYSKVILRSASFDDNGYIRVNGTTVLMDDGDCCSAGILYVDIDVTNLVSPGVNTIYGYATNCCGICVSAGADFSVERCWDNDGDGHDGFSADYCPQGEDCNDSDPDVALSWDSDEDGYYSVNSCKTPNNDCDDARSEINPSTVWYLDNDGDKFPVLSSLTVQCEKPGEGYRLASEVYASNDCNDNDASLTLDTAVWYLDNDGDKFPVLSSYTVQCEKPGEGYRPASEVYTSNDCNDNDASLTPEIRWVLDADGDGWVASYDIVYCPEPGTGYVLYSGLHRAIDCNDDPTDEKAKFIYPGAVEVCDGLDNDCTGAVDDGPSWDRDGDGYYTTASCATPNDDCYDNPLDGGAEIHPGAEEVCDWSDNDCDGEMNEGLYLDNDKDGYYGPDSCQYPYLSDDCDDTDEEINPATFWYQDSDGDGYWGGSGSVSCTSPGSDYKLGKELVSTSVLDCMDVYLVPPPRPSPTGERMPEIGSSIAPATVYPGAPEVCDQWDNDCDYVADEGLSWDRDGDGHFTADSCATPNDDCNDDPDKGGKGIYPGTEEVCGDAIDNNCSGMVDEDCCIDDDGDGHYTLSSTCAPADDCNDGDPDVKPGAVEVCGDKIDNDCDTYVDEDCALTLKYISGDGQSGEVCTTLGQPFVVAVEGGDAASDATVEWRIADSPEGSGPWFAGYLSIEEADKVLHEAYLGLGSLSGEYTVTAECADCTEGSPQTFTATAECPGVPAYYQTNYSDDPYDTWCKTVDAEGNATGKATCDFEDGVLKDGYVQYTIAQKGCALTSLAMVMGRYWSEADPAVWDDFLTASGGYDYKADVKWDVPTRIDESLNVYRVDTTSLSAMDTYLAKCMPVIVKVDNSGGPHWVVVTAKSGSTYTINDPGYSSRITLLSYDNKIYKLVVYEDTGECQ